MAELALDVVEQMILVRLDVKDLIRCKSVCKSWQSVISSPFFVKAHLKHAYANDCNNPELGHRRICLSYGIVHEESWYYCDAIHIVGSCNGLLCVSPIGVEFVVTNPSTREHKKLPTPSYRLRHIEKFNMLRDVVCWGFGYDSSLDDYKVIVGFTERTQTGIVTLFQVLTLKSNTWKIIGCIKYSTLGGSSGILCGGALHWFMTDKNKKKVIISFDLSTQEFTKSPLPDADLLYHCDSYDCNTLGVIENCLCIYSNDLPLSTKKWVMKNNKWELYVDDHCRAMYDVAHYLPITLDFQMNSIDGVDDGTRVPVNGDYIRASIFVKSLVSPHLHVNDNNNNSDGHKRNAKIHAMQQGQEDTKSVESSAKGNIRKRKRSKRSCKHKKPRMDIVKTC